MTMKDLKKFIKDTKKNDLDLVLKLKMPNQKEPEIIMNYNSSLDAKLDYYIKTYDNKLRHNFNKEVQIVDMLATKIPF